MFYLKLGVDKMISDVVVSGHLGKRMGAFLRELEVEREDILTKKINHFVIPLADWNKNKESYFHNIPVGAFVFIKGRVEADEENGLFIVAELLEVYSQGRVLSC
jgi:hypothetical protein